MYKAIEVAKYIVAKCVVDKKYISNLHLQKILYYVQKEFIKKQQEKLFEDDIEAWQFGPVVPEVYWYYCGFGSNKIMIADKHEEIDRKKREIIDRIVVEKREKNPWDLVKDTHKEGGAWDQTYMDGLGDKCVIDEDLIAEEA